MDRVFSAAEEHLFRVLEAMGDGVKDARDRALLLLGFAGGFRRSELVGCARVISHWCYVAP